MRLALHSVSYSGTWGGQAVLDLPSFLRKARQLGYTAIELTGKRPHASPLDLGERDRRQIKHVLDDEGLELTCMASYHDWSGPPEHRDMAYLEKDLVYFREVARLASELGGSLVRTYTGYFHDGVAYRQQWDRCVEGIASAARIAADYGITLGVQNHSCIASHPDSLLDLIRDVGEPNIGIVLDAPMVTDHALPLRETVLRIGKLIVHTHLTDFVRRVKYRYIPETVTYQENGIEMVAVPVGQGDVDYRTFVAVLNDIGYRGALSYEMCSPLVGGGREANLDQCAKETLTYVRDLLKTFEARQSQDSTG